jgi:hypothetical protein
MIVTSAARLREKDDEAPFVDFNDGDLSMPCLVSILAVKK